MGCTRRGRTLRKDLFLPSKHLLSSFSSKNTSKNPSQNLRCLCWKPLPTPSKNPSKTHSEMAGAQRGRVSKQLTNRQANDRKGRKWPILYTEQMDAEGWGRKLLLTLPLATSDNPEKQTVGTVTASRKMPTLPALSSSRSAGTAKRGCLGRGKALE